MLPQKPKAEKIHFIEGTLWPVQQDATELNRPLVNPQNIMKIGNWNVGTLYRRGNIAQVAKEMTSRNRLGISETHIEEE